ncbi:MAG: UbiD family decarboxylase domain-containing protein, partial [Dehalococcoidia bacterium]
MEREVDTRFEIAAGIRENSDRDGPALLFQNVRGFPGWKVAAGVYATQKLIALALGLPLEADEDAMVRRYLECEEGRVEPKLVSTGPVKEVIIRGEDVDLTKLPIPTYSALDAGPYLSAGVEIARDPETGIQNVSIHRRMILGKDKTA